MTKETNTPEQPSTPQQVEEIFVQLGELTALKGTNYGDSHSFGEAAVTVPGAIAEHFPATETDSESAGRTVYVTQKFDRTTGQPVLEGLVGLVTFIQKEKRDADLVYATHVNYHVISNDGVTHRLERHVTTTEFGKAAAARHSGRAAVTREAMEQNLDELKALKTRVEESRKVEAELGLSTVSALEASQVAETLAALNSGK